MSLFRGDKLRIRLKQEPSATWRFGEAFEDLGGTARTLDKALGAVPLGKGVCSRSGFSVLDDSLDTHSKLVRMADF